MSKFKNSLDRLYSEGKLQKEKYEYLKELEQSIDLNYVAKSKEDKIAMLSKQCSERIINGIDFTWEGETHHYSLDITDQMELNVLLANVKAGATKTSWHYNGGQCEEWSAEKFLAFAQQALYFATYTKVRFNTGIRPLVESMEDLTEINAITLDTELNAETEANIVNLVNITLNA